MTTIAPPRQDVDRIIAWHCPQIVDRYARTIGASREDSLACFEAWKQFMAVAAVRPAGESVPSDRIDDMWHTAVVFTARYREFCDTCVGRFVDHCPEEHSDQPGYDATRAAAAELFGELDARYWTDESARCR
jgi:hypothetical protein